MLFTQDWTEEQKTAARATARAVIRWLQIRRAFERSDILELPEEQLLADLWHSALVERLLSGKEPLDRPPPRSFSYPWYELVERGWGWARQVHVPAEDPYLVLIDQFPWRIVKRHEDGTLEVETDRAPGRWKLIPGSGMYTVLRTFRLDPVYEEGYVNVGLRVRFPPESKLFRVRSCSPGSGTKSSPMMLHFGTVGTRSVLELIVDTNWYPSWSDPPSPRPPSAHLLFHAPAEVAGEEGDLVKEGCLFTDQLGPHREVAVSPQSPWWAAVQEVRKGRDVPTPMALLTDVVDMTSFWNLMEKLHEALLRRGRQ
jgi:hypothetical protein